MSDETWDALRATPLGEVRRRAAIVDRVAEVAPVEVAGAQRYAWNDGGGQSAVWYFTPDDRALLLTFDHESPLNLYAEDEDTAYPLQRSFYDGVPEELLRLVRNQPENYESLNIRDPKSGDTLLYAGGVFWYDGSRWQLPEGLTGYCEREHLDLFNDSGFDYCLDTYLFGRDFTPESLVDHLAEEGWYEDEREKQEALAGIREIFARQ
ncbi:hypothetical protein [Streptomyces sp. NPDC127190]|uniref:hypothetical protein n=1 Tax=unclassified Streptomyces TaxID=2593676 RepID=UPI003639F5AD